MKKITILILALLCFAALYRIDHYNYEHKIWGKGKEKYSAGEASIVAGRLNKITWGLGEKVIFFCVAWDPNEKEK